MTKINQLNDTAQSISTPNSSATKPGQTDAFKNALAQAIDSKGADTKKTNSTSGLGEIAPVELNISDQSDIVSGKTGKLLDMLEKYVSKLEDPNIPLKSMAPVLEKIKQDAGSLEKETLNLNDSDKSLKEIATTTIATAQTEYLKFQRGDYLS